MVNIIKRILLFVILFIVISSTQTFALMENRPLNTSEPTLLKRGQFQIATGGTFLKQANNDKEWDWVSDIEYGIFDWFEYDIEIPRVSNIYGDADLENVNGLGDISMCWAVNPVKEGKFIPTISFACYLKTKSGDEDRNLGTGTNDFTIQLLMLKTFGKLSVVMNFGYTFVGKPSGENLRDTFSNNYALKYELADKLVLVSEIYGQTNQNKDASNDPWNMLGGFIYNINDFLAFDCGVGTGLNSESPALRVTSGFVLTF
ncbi:MAG: transporter [Candidatus Ancaeobacter aquaticus]|nr:transporter [Candidatus Ancaeobacter aquaticus]